MHTRSGKSTSSEEDVPMELSTSVLVEPSASAPAGPSTSVPVELSVSVPFFERRAYWSMPDDDAKLIDFFLTKKQASTSNNMFKSGAFGEAAKEVNTIRVKGSEKTASSCKARWGRVCISFVCVLPVS